MSNGFLNDKLNSDRRLIEEEVNLKTVQVIATRNSEGFLSLQKASAMENALLVTPADHITLRSLLSLTFPINFLGASDSYLSLGKDEESGTVFATLAPAIACKRHEQQRGSSMSSHKVFNMLFLNRPMSLTAHKTGRESYSTH